MEVGGIKIIHLKNCQVRAEGCAQGSMPWGPNVGLGDPYPGL